MLLLLLLSLLLLLVLGLQLLWAAAILVAGGWLLPRTECEHRLDVCHTVSPSRVARRGHNRAFKKGARPVWVVTVAAGALVGPLTPVSCAAPGSRGLRAAAAAVCNPGPVMWVDDIILQPQAYAIAYGHASS